jgi:hypothetical protein
LPGVKKMARKPDLTRRGVEKLRERERTVGLEPGDEASRWLEEHDPPPEPKLPKSAGKNKTLHQWRRRSG